VLTTLSFLVIFLLPKQKQKTYSFPSFFKEGWPPTGGRGGFNKSIYHGRRQEAGVVFKKTIYHVRRQAAGVVLTNQYIMAADRRPGWF
jgi:hypothetical protein